MENITPKINFPKELSNLHDLTGKVAYLPGGYGGLGEAIAWGFAVQGGKVVVSGRSQEKGEKLAREIREAGYEASSTQVEVKSLEDIRKSVDFVVNRYGSIDILMNCVGIQREEPITEVSEEAYDEVYRVNLKSAMFLGQAAAKYQIEQGGGKQIHLLSVRSHLGIRGRGYSAYCSTKGALVMLIKQHAMELAPYGITVNGIAPTFIHTEMLRVVFVDGKFPQHLIDRIPLGRIGDPKDLVGSALLFASDASSFITGQILYLDGGITASQ